MVVTKFTIKETNQELKILIKWNQSKGDLLLSFAFAIAFCMVWVV